MLLIPATTLIAISFSITGTPTNAVVSFESSVDGINWSSFSVVQVGVGTTTRATIAGTYNATTNALFAVRARLTAISAGSFTVSSSLTSATTTTAGTKSGTLLNWNQGNTSKITAMMGTGAQSTARSRLAFVGDSYPAGYQANNGQGLLGARPKAFPAQLAGMLATKGFNARADYAVGDGGSTILGGTITSLEGYDSRLTFTGTGIGLLNSFNALGGSMWQLQDSGDSVTFTPGNSFDTLELVVAFNTSFQGSFTISFNGGSTAFTVANNPNISVQHLTYTVPGGVTATSATIKQAVGDTFISLMGTRLSTSTGIEVINCGISGVQVDVLALAPTNTGDTNTWNTRAAALALLDTNATNVTALNGWFNDQSAGQTVEQIQASVQTMITTFKAYGDVFYMSYAPLSLSQISQANYDMYQSAAIAVALQNNIPVIYVPNQLAPYSINQPLGLYGDVLHLNAAGHALIARIIMAAFESVA